MKPVHVQLSAIHSSAAESVALCGSCSDSSLQFCFFCTSFQVALHMFTVKNHANTDVTSAAGPYNITL